MRALRFGGAFRKDLKRITKRGYDRARLDSITDALRQGTPLPAAVRAHPLKGEWMGYWECHVAPDWLLIYKSSAAELFLARTGTHADLFKL
ncbi:MAG TPA: type II toxin-antitoxin system YafQ family toxin [Xanthobacteraceae bacterium]|nr:type II toxin-antitoxin system YafQ family toxin [Xanthobacteraceae bacterium]